MKGNNEGLLGVVGTKKRRRKMKGHGERKKGVDKANWRQISMRGKEVKGKIKDYWRKIKRHRH